MDPRKAKRLAHRVRHNARQHGLSPTLWVSPLQRSRDVGRWLRRWGWQVRVDARLTELNFGAWDGLPWAQVPWSEVQAWQDDLLGHEPGGGESLVSLARRVQAFCASIPSGPCQLVGHGGWINALVHVAPGLSVLAAADWPAPPRHGTLTRLTLPAHPSKSLAPRR